MVVAALLCCTALCFVAAAYSSTVDGPTTGDTGGSQQVVLDRQLLSPKKVSYFVVDTYNHRVMQWEECAHEGKVVAGGHGPGHKLTHLKFPVDIAIDSHHKDSLVIVDRENHRVVEWPKGATQGTIIVGNNDGKKGSSLHDLSFPNGVTILHDTHGHSHIIVADTGNHRILDCQRGHHDCKVVVSGDKYKKDEAGKGCGSYDVHSPGDVKVNKHGHYIITDKYYDRVVECYVMNASKAHSHGHIIAGGKKKNGDKCKKDCYGSELYELYYPEGTAIDGDDILVADGYNNRIMKWSPNATQGERKVGKKDGYGSKLSHLHLPRGVVVDQGSYLIADSMNHRILRWHPGDEKGHVVAGGHGFGSKKSQLHLPHAVAMLHHQNDSQACPPVSTSSPVSLVVSSAVLVCTMVLASVS